MAYSIEQLRRALGVVWFLGQMYILLYPPIPMLERPLHVMMATALVILWNPLRDWRERGSPVPHLIDLAILAALIATAAYYVLRANYLTERMENVDPVLLSDVIFGVLTLLLVCEAVRRVLGWNSALGHRHFCRLCLGRPVVARLAPLSGIRLSRIH